MGSSSGFTPSPVLGGEPDRQEVQLDAILLELTKQNMLLTILVGQFTGDTTDLDLIPIVE